MSNKIGSCGDSRLRLSREGEAERGPVQKPSHLRLPIPLTAFDEKRCVSASPSSGGTSPLMIHPLADDTRAANYAEVPIFAIDQEGQRGAVQLLQMLQIQLRPQAALGRRLNQLFHIRQMSLK